MMRKSDAKDVYAVILVGGKGRRLRPLSTGKRPKAFLSVTGDGKTMFRLTLDRIRRIVKDDNIIVVANKAHEGIVKKDFRGIKKENLILEGVSRNTAPAISLAAGEIKKRYYDGIMVVLPSDQYVINEKMYLDSVREGVGFVRDNPDVLVVLGVKPESASTHFGYIKVYSPRLCPSGFGGQAWSMGHGLCKVAKFTEKPDLKTAKRYVKTGRYLWNTGLFIFSAGSILKALAKFVPKISEISEKPDGGMKRYKDMPDISIDYAVMEKADNIYCAKGAYGWNDIGNFENLKKVLRRENKDFIEKAGKVISII